MKELTLAMIKPDAVSSGHIGAIIGHIEKSGLKIIEMRMMSLSVDACSEFYAEHKGRSFFVPMVEFMCSGPVVALVLEGDNAVVIWRYILGATNPIDARPGTIRSRYGDHEGPMYRNAAHGSDSCASAARELAILIGKAKP